MNSRFSWRVVAALSFFPAGARAAHPFLCTDSYGNAVSAVSADGRILWRHVCQHPQDCWVLANGPTCFVTRAAHWR